MGFFDAIKKGFEAFGSEFSKPDSFSKGDLFEAYVRDNIFKSSDFSLVHKTHGYDQNKKDFIEDSLLPDYLFKDNKTGKKFYVEVKYREGVYYQNKIEWCKPFQLKRYQSFGFDYPVFLCLGIGDSPKKLGEIFIIPMSVLRYNALYDSFLDKYTLDPKVSVTSRFIWGLN